MFRGMGLAGADASERLLLSAGLGAGTTSLTMLGLGLAGFWRPRPLSVLFFAVAVLGLVRTLLDVRWSRKGGAEQVPEAAVFPAPGRLGFLAYAALVVIACAVLLNLMETAAPEIFYDSLVYHLALPKLYLIRGRIVPTPQNIFSGMPFGVEMLYGLALSLSDEHLAALLNCSFGWGAAAALWAWLRRRSSAESGVLGALIFCLCPVVLYSGTQCGVDLGAAFCCFPRVAWGVARVGSGGRTSSAPLVGRDGHADRLFSRRQIYRPAFGRGLRPRACLAEPAERAVFARLRLDGCRSSSGVFAVAPQESVFLRRSALPVPASAAGLDDARALGDVLIRRPAPRSGQDPRIGRRLEKRPA